MERKEAIEIFEDELYFSMKPACQKVGKKFTIPTKVYCEALCMAIESLKADESSLEEIPTITIPVEDYMELLENKPVHARWESGYSFPDGAYWKCTHCNTLIKVKLPMDYCNACGAKMDKGEDHGTEVN